MKEKLNKVKTLTQTAAKATGKRVGKAARATGKAIGKGAKAAGHAAKVTGDILAAALLGNEEEESLSLAAHDVVRDAQIAGGETRAQSGGRDVSGPREGYSIPDLDIIRLFRATANAVWKLKGRMIDVETGEPKDEFRKVWRHVETIDDALKEIGVETIDWTGKRYDDGMSLKVFAEDESASGKTAQITRTDLPTIRFRNAELGVQAEIQKGEVEVSRPAGDADRK